ncbi:MAG TPA: hypothetical protein VGH99_17000 [Pseudonocardia sp.]|jgi:DNA-binding NarL/FixJ family response regulator
MRPPRTSEAAGPPRHPTVIIDDHELAGTALRDALVEHGVTDCTVVAVAEALTRADQAPGLAVLDLSSAAGSGPRAGDPAAVVEPLRRHGWTVLALGDHRGTASFGSALAAGAYGHNLTAGDSLATLARAVASAAQGRDPMCPAERARPRPSPGRPGGESAPRRAPGQPDPRPA